MESQSRNSLSNSSSLWQSAQDMLNAIDLELKHIPNDRRIYVSSTIDNSSKNMFCDMPWSEDCIGKIVFYSIEEFIEDLLNSIY